MQIELSCEKLVKIGRNPRLKKGTFHLRGRPGEFMGGNFATSPEPFFRPASRLTDRQSAPQNVVWDGWLAVVCWHKSWNKF
jgi:hypothetical protein